MSTSPAPPFVGRDMLRRLAPSIVVSGVVPLVVYAVVRPHVHDDAVALLAGAIVPAVFTIGKLVRRGRLDPVGVMGVLGFGIAVLVLVASGGSPLVLKLQDAVVTGPLGLVCLASVAVGGRCTASCSGCSPDVTRRSNGCCTRRAAGARRR